jgi:hypothetical protein
MQRPSAVAKVERRYLIPERLDDISAALLIAALLRAAQGFHAYTFEVALYHINACAVLAANLDEVARNGSTLRRMPHGDRLTCRTFGRTRLWLPMFVLARTRRKTRSTCREHSSPASTVVRSSVRFVQTGLYSGLVLPSSIHEEIDRFARQTQCFGNLDRRLEFRRTMRMPRTDLAVRCSAALFRADP